MYYRDEVDNKYELFERHNAVIKEQQEKTKSIAEGVMGLSKERELNSKLLESFKVNTKDFLLTEAITFFANKSGVLDSGDQKKVCKNVIYNYVKENKSMDIIRNISSKTLLLSGVCNIINESYDSIMEKCDKCNKDTFNIKKSDINKFYDSLEGLKCDKICDKINNKVMDAMDDFIQGNVNDKLDMEDTANKIKTKVDKIEDKDEEVKTEYARLYLREVTDKQEYRQKNLFEEMVSNVSRNVLKCDLKNNFINESGKFDMKSIIDDTKAMYLALETMNTIKIYDINNKEIHNILDSIN